MFSSEAIAFFSIVLTAISLIVTIVGWTITFRKQKEILKHQIEGDVAKEKISQYVKLTLIDIEKIRNWIRRGFEIYRLLDDIEILEIRNKADKLNVKWKAEYEEEIHLIAKKLEIRSKYLPEKKYKLTDDLDMFCRKVDLVLRGIKDSTQGYECGYYAQSSLDILIWELLDQPVPKYYL